MSTKKIPQYGDPEILPKGEIIRPSAQRQIFNYSGRRVEPGPQIEERFFEAPDLQALPQWVRQRGDEWTTVEFRAAVFLWLIGFFDARDWAAQWDIREVGSAPKSGRLPADQQHLVLGIQTTAGSRVETAVAFPTTSRDDPAAIRAVLDSAAAALDALHAQG